MVFKVVVVAQLEERSLPIPEVHGSNLVIGKNFILKIYRKLYWKDENKEKRPGMAHFFKKWYSIYLIWIDNNKLYLVNLLWTST